MQTRKKEISHPDCPAGFVYLMNSGKERASELLKIIKKKYGEQSVKTSSKAYDVNNNLWDGIAFFILEEVLASEKWQREGFD